MSKTIPDARLHYNPDERYIAQLISEASGVVGSRNKLAPMLGISRRKLGYMEAGEFTATFADQFILEAIAKAGK